MKETFFRPTAATAIPLVSPFRRNLPKSVWTKFDLGVDGGFDRNWDRVDQTLLKIPRPTVPLAPALDSPFALQPCLKFELGDDPPRRLSVLLL